MLDLPITPGRYKTSLGDTAIVTHVEQSPGHKYPVVGYVIDGVTWLADGRFLDDEEGGSTRLVERLPDEVPDSSAPDALPEPSARMRRENERLRAANRLHEIARDLCADEVARLREQIADLESRLAWAEDQASMHWQESSILRDQLSEQGVTAQVGLTISGEIVRVPNPVPEPSP